MITITQVPFEIEAADTNETEVRFDPSVTGPGTKVCGWIVSGGSYKVSIGRAISGNTPEYTSGANDKDWGRIKPHLESLFIQAGGAGDKISFSI